jgi:hypothetical protein
VRVWVVVSFLVCLISGSPSFDCQLC